MKPSGLAILLLALASSAPAQEPAAPPSAPADETTATLRLLPPVPADAPEAKAETPLKKETPPAAESDQLKSIRERLAEARAREKEKEQGAEVAKDTRTEAERKRDEAKEKEQRKEREEIETIQRKISRLNADRDLLMAENSLRSEKLKKELGTLTDERERMTAQFQLERERIANQLAKQRLEAERWALESDLILKELAIEDARLRLETAKATTAQKKEESLLKAQNTLAMEKLTASGNVLRAKDTDIKLAKMDGDAELMRFDAKIRTFDRQELATSLVPRERIAYDKEPFDGKRLLISDRRIELNGLISYMTGEHVSERINYYNNLNPEHPIFIIIDSSPGGSVMAGFQILKAMESSKAPVYVVVKTFAASMAACITTLAEKSFAYPSAMLLHHQVSYGMAGNLRQQQEELDQAKEWFTRLGGPVAKKMGISVEEFVKRMYAKNSTGDWQEFADKAQKLKWVDHIAEEIVETALLKNPDLRYTTLPGLPPMPSSEKEASSGAGEETDAKGSRYMRLPRLLPFDCYHLFDPGHYYRQD